MNKVAYFAILLFLSSCKIADLGSDQALADTQKEAKALLEEVADAHGTAKWDSISTYEALFEDEFYGTIGKMASPFKGNPAQFRLQYIPKVKDAKMTFSHEKMKGQIWSYTKGGGPEGHKEAEFWLPTYQYFIEFPGRILEANVLRLMGEESVEGKNYLKVFASWDQIAPTKNFDQYIIWINKETKLIEKIAYTVREAGKWITGQVSFNEMKDFDGLLIPTVMPVGSNLLKEGKLLHKMSIKEIKFDTFNKSELLSKTTP